MGQVSLGKRQMLGPARGCLIDSGGLGGLRGGAAKLSDL
jgi:hypothetical protein